MDNTKTYSSINNIPLPESLINIFKSAIALKNKEMLKCYASYNKANKHMIFLSENSEFIDAGNIDES